MDSKNPEQELEAFLAQQPSWLQKLLQLNFGLTHDEMLAWQSSGWWKDTRGIVEEEYLRLLKRCPAKWNEYCRRRRDEALKYLPSGLPGRPSKDALRQEAIELKRSLSYPKVAKPLNDKNGPGTTTEGAIRWLIKYRKPPSDPKS
jgi:hypothetical protein